MTAKPRPSAFRALQPLDLLRRLVEDGGDLVEPLLAHVVGGDPVPERGEQVADRALDRPAAGAALALAGAGQPLEQGFDLVRARRDAPRPRR
jgi:hypothetical protein